MTTTITKPQRDMLIGALAYLMANERGDSFGQRDLEAYLTDGNTQAMPTFQQIEELQITIAECDGLLAFGRNT